MIHEDVIEKVAATLVQAGSTFLPDKKAAYRRVIARECNPLAKWTMETILQNAEVAEINRCPLCDDTGIPHLFLEIGPHQAVTGDLLDSIKMGIAVGLRRLPGRPMAVKGNDYQRLDQSAGLFEESDALESSPILIKQIEEEVLRLHILMLGGGPAIRGITHRVFHKHSVDVVINEIIERAIPAVKQLGCTPSVLAIGVGRSQFEATSMMMEAMVYGNFDRQSAMEKAITDGVNKSNVGPLGLGGKTSVLATFMKIGPQRASGVRIVAMRPCCCFEPRKASILL